MRVKRGHRSAQEGRCVYLAIEGGIGGGCLSTLAPPTSKPRSEATNETPGEGATASAAPPQQHCISRRIEPLRPGTANVLADAE